jgi:hypothetical protein
MGSDGCDRQVARPRRDLEEAGTRAHSLGNETRGVLKTRPVPSGVPRVLGRTLTLVQYTRPAGAVNYVNSM